MNWHSIRDGLIFTVHALSIVRLVTSVATMFLLIGRIQSREKEDVKPEVRRSDQSHDHLVAVSAHELGP